MEQKSAMDNLSGKNLDKLRQIAESGEGKQIQEMLSGSEIEQAAKTGDIESLKGALSQFLQTEAGANLARRLSDLMK